jgi:type II secretory pathway component PulF
MYRLHAGTGFMLATGALVKAGVQVPEILRIFLRSATPYYDERITAALRWVSNGVNLGEALYRSKMDFPDRETVKELRSYAELDNFDENLIKIGHQCVDESVERISNQASILRNLAFVFLGVVFGTIALGIFAIQQQVVSNI